MIKKIMELLIPGYNLSAKIIRMHRISSFFYKKHLEKLAKWYSYKIYKKYNCCISYMAEIGNNIEFPHPIGVVIGAGVKIGDNCIIYQNVTLGRKNRNISEYPTVGNNVTIYCNSTVIGNIKIGDNSVIGCNSVILKSVEKNSKCIGVVK